MTISAEIKTDKIRRVGYEGGMATLNKYGREQMRRWGKLGGRPRNKNIDVIRSEQNSQRPKEDERSDRLPAGSVRRRLRDLLINLIGEPVACGSAGSPERSGT
jgi:hypothetical protein